MTIILVVLGALLWTNIAVAAEVVDVSLAANVSERQPVAAFTPAAACRTSTPPAYRVPVVDSQAFASVYLWTKIAATRTQGNPPPVLQGDRRRVRDDNQHRLVGRTCAGMADMERQVHPAVGHAQGYVEGGRCRSGRGGTGAVQRFLQRGIASIDTCPALRYDLQFLAARTWGL